MNWLITGGCGFIGVNLIKRLKHENHYIRILDNLRVGSREDLGAVTDYSTFGESTDKAEKNVELLVGDITDKEAASKAVLGCDVVVHLAAHTGVVPSVENPSFDFEQNAQGTFNILEACRQNGVKKFILASSGAPLGDQDPPIHEDKVPKPQSPYGASKLVGEAYCSAYFGSYGLNTACLRFSNVYGAYSFKKGSVVALFFRRALAGKPLVIFGDGEQTRDFIHVDDLCQAVVSAALAEVGGEIFQIATGQETTVNEMTEKIKMLVERDTNKTVNIEFKPARAGEIFRNVSDISKAREMLDYKPKIRLDTGLEQTWDWFKNNF
jgi:UDP-glucose 4-epimerase